MTEISDRWSVPDFDTAYTECRRRNGQGIKVVLDILGEDIRSPKAAETVTSRYLELIGAIGTQGLNASISVKLSALGYLGDLEGSFERMFKIADSARSHKVGFEIDVEWTPMVDHTIEVAETCAKRGDLVTVAVQAYLNRTVDDIPYLHRKNVRVRLVKGAYRGEVSDFLEIQNRFIKNLGVLVESKRDFSIGTHDPDLVSWVKQHLPLSKGRIEFGFLRGLSDGTKYQLSSDGWRVAEYIPIGEDVKGYVGRREEYLRKIEALGRVPLP